MRELLDLCPLEELMNLMDGFSCVLNPDVEDFIRTKAIMYERSAQARSYIIVDDELGLDGDILAYFSLALHIMTLGDGVSKTRRKKLVGLHFDPDEAFPKIPCLLIGQMGRDDHCYRSILPGQHIMDSALDALSGVNATVGGRSVKIDSVDVQSVLDLHHRNRFFDVQRSDDGLIEMVLLY